MAKTTKNQQIQDLYITWQLQLARRYVALQLEPLTFEHIQRRETEKCLRFSPVLRWLIGEFNHDLLAMAEWLGPPRSGEVLIGVSAFERIFSPCDSAELVGAG